MISNFIISTNGLHKGKNYNWKDKFLKQEND